MVLKHFMHPLQAKVEIIFSVFPCRISGPMPGGAAEGAGLFSSTLLCALGLGSAVRTFQV